MSVTLLLVPLAVAAATAAQAALGRRADGKVICEVQTRMRDEGLLADALRDTGATVTAAAGALTAAWADSGTGATFSRGTDGIWSAHFTGVAQERAVELVTTVDTAYGRQVQRAVVARLREQAPAAGLRLESESVGEDASVRLVFEVGEVRA
jgi:hypothetical protein